MGSLLDRREAEPLARGSVVEGTIERRELQIRGRAPDLQRSGELDGVIPAQGMAFRERAGAPHEGIVDLDDVVRPHSASRSRTT